MAPREENDTQAVAGFEREMTDKPAQAPQTQLASEAQQAGTVGERNVAGVHQGTTGAPGMYSQGYNPQQAQQGYNPQQELGAQAGYNPQSQGYNPQQAQQGYNPQSQGYNPQQAQQGYNPQQEHGAQGGYNPQSQGYNPQQAQQGYNPQSQGYNPQQAQQGYNPQQEHGAQAGYNPQSQGSAFPEHGRNPQAPAVKPAGKETVAMKAEAACKSIGKTSEKVAAGAAAGLGNLARSAKLGLMAKAKPKDATQQPAADAHGQPGAPPAPAKPGMLNKIAGAGANVAGKIELMAGQMETAVVPQRAAQHQQQQQQQQQQQPGYAAMPHAGPGAH